ncbi:hypothetical protein IJ472_01955, partial [bacterium]|nr:hypothetical protein [bacterium]
MRLRRTSPRNDKIASHPELDSGSHNITEKSFNGEIAYQVRYDRTKNNEDIDMVMKSNYRVLSVAALAGLAGLCATNSAQATEAPITPTLGDNSIINFNKTDTNSDTTITNYKYNSETGTLSKSLYEIVINKTEYGNNEGDISTTYGIETNEDGTAGSFVKNPTTPYGQTITYSYNSSDKYTPSTTITGAIKDVSSFVFPEEATSYTQLGGTGIVHESETITNYTNYLLKDNQVICSDWGFYNDSRSASVVGGGVANTGKISELSGYFTNNSIQADVSTSYANLSALGGALYNSGEIASVNAEFVGNHLYDVTNRSGYTVDLHGGALYNTGKIGEINGNFIENSIDVGYNGYGGALYNSGEIGNITGDFISNKITKSEGGQSHAYAKGVAIFNTGTIGNISGDFIENEGTSSDNYIIYNLGTIGDISGDFLGNKGLVIDNYNSEIGNITANFINNSGTAIYNETSEQYTSTIGNITGVFINNGTAIYNIGRSGSTNTMGDITGDFIRNDTAIRNSIYWGAQANCTIGNVIGNFIQNRSAISNGDNTTMGSITGNFIENEGGAIHNSGTLTGDIIGTFYFNNDAITNTGTANNIDGVFYGNTTTYSRGSEWISYDHQTSGYKYFYGGAAIYNTSKLANISGEFISNTISGASSGKNKAYVQGGALYNSGEIQSINAHFDSNSATLSGDEYSRYPYSESIGGAIYNKGNIGAIEGSFTNNIVASEKYSYHVYGGAVGNIGTINSVNAHFENNKSSYYAGALYNTGTIEEVYGTFKGNTARYAGALYNTGTINKISAQFLGNYAKGSNGNSADTGALYNSGTINELSSLFDSNYVRSDANYGYAGVLYNTGTINNLNSDFKNNHLYTLSNAHGGAVYNSDTIGSLSGNYIGNYISTEEAAYGGAIYNTGTIGVIEDLELQDCIQLQIIDPNSGEVLDTLYATMDNLTQEEIEKGQYKYEIVESITIPLDELRGDNDEVFNSVEEFLTYANSQGENILTQNPTKFEPLPISIANSTFSNNSISSMDSNIPNTELYVSVGEYKYTYKNTTTGESFTVYNVYYDKETIEDLISQGYKIEYKEPYEYEYNISDDNWASQKATYENYVSNGYYTWDSQIDDVLAIIPEDAFLTYEQSNLSYGGAIYNESETPLVIVNTQFDNNFSSGFGGAIANLGEFDNDEGSLTSRLVIDKTTFTANKSGYVGGAIYDYLDIVVRLGNDNGPSYDSLDIGFYNAGPDTSDSNLSNFDSTIPHLEIKSSTFTDNESKLGGAIAGEYIVKVSGSIDIPVEESLMPLDMAPELPTVVDPDNMPDILVNIENSSFIGNKAVKGGALYFDRVYAQVEGVEEKPMPASLELPDTESEDVVNSTNSTSFVQASDEIKYNLTIKNTSFVNNIATSTDSDTAKGGAIYTNMNTKILAEGQNVVFSNNKIISNGSEQLNDIHLVSNRTFAEIVENNYYSDEGPQEPTINEYDYNPVVLNLHTENNGTISLDGTIDGEVVKTSLKISKYGDLYEMKQESLPEEKFAYNLDVTGDGSGRVIFGNAVKKANISISDTFVQLAKDTNFDNDNLTLNSGTLSMINNQAGVSALNSLTVTGDTNVLVDVDLENQTMDRFTASEYGSHSGNLNVAGMNLLSDAVSDNTEILFAEQGLKDNVTYGGEELPHNEYQTTLYTPIYKYNVAYDNRDDAGYFVFARQASSSGNQSEVFNPAVLGSSTSATVGAIGTMNQAFNYAFQHSADYMHIPYLERVSMRDRNKYALSITGDATDMGRFSPLYQPSDEGSSVWVKPYATFENVPLKNGPKVSNITYGTLVGFDSEMQSLKRGWDRVWTGYIGYNGASQRYSGIDSTQNGGLIGGTMT